MNRLLEGKICIVTGAGRGIGMAITKLFAENGALVYANDVTPNSVGNWISDAPSEVQERVRPLYFDVTDEKQIRDNAMKIKRESGHIDILINNAGIEYNELIGMISEKRMKEMFNVNVFGTINMIQIASRLMSKQKKGGCIINISSLVGLRGNSGQLVYSATKGAIISLTKSAAKELADKGIRVNSIAPGLTQTEMMEQADLSKLQERISNIRMGRLATPLDIANGCLLLSSDYAEYISGQILSVDGCTIM